MSKTNNPKHEPSVPVDETGRPKIKRLFFKDNVYVGVDNSPMKSLAEGSANWAQSGLSFSPDYRFLRIEYTKGGQTTITLVPIENVASIMLDN